MSKCLTIILFVQFDIHLSPSVALRGGISLHSLTADDDDVIVDQTETGRNGYTCSRRVRYILYYMPVK